MRDRQTCSDCGKMSPETETNYTLISAQFGWRLTRSRAENGDLIVEWRCAECWRDHKKKKNLSEEPSSSPQPKPKTVPRVGPPIPRAGPAGGAARSSRPPARVSSKPPASGPANPPVAPRKRP